MSTIRMHRQGQYADVHPDEVANWSPYGWNVVEEENSKKAMAKPPVEADPELIAMVDDRALPGLESLGIRSVSQLVSKYHSDPKSVLDLAYITKRTISKVTGAN